jgi:hypothetical protein
LQKAQVATHHVGDGVRGRDVDVEARVLAPLDDNDGHDDERNLNSVVVVRISQQWGSALDQQQQGKQGK